MAFTMRSRVASRDTKHKIMKPYTLRTFYCSNKNVLNNSMSFHKLREEEKNTRKRNGLSLQIRKDCDRENERIKKGKNAKKETNNKAARTTSQRKRKKQTVLQKPYNVDKHCTVAHYPTLYPFLPQNS